MALIIEDGSIVPGANSFATAAELAAYADDYGLTIPATEPEQERLLRRAALQMQALSWKGRIVELDQPLAWPRVGVSREGSRGLIWGRNLDFGEEYEVASNVIPAGVKQGQMALAAEIYEDDQTPAEDARGPIVSETVGPLSTTYGKAQSWQLRPAATKQSYANFGPYLQAANQVRLARG